MSDAVPNQERRFWGAPVKHFSLGGGFVAAMLTLTPMKQWFFTREEGKAQSAQIADLKEVVKDGFASQTKIFLDHVAEEARVREHSNEVMRQRIADEKSDRMRDGEEINKRFDLVLELFKIRQTKVN